MHNSKKVEVKVVVSSLVAVTADIVAILSY